MAKGERDLAKERHWREVLKRQQSSGFNVRAFCQREQIAESAFHFWRRTIRARDDRAKPALPVPPFVPAVITSDIASEACTLELAGGHVLRMPGISVERLADLIAVCLPKTKIDNLGKSEVEGFGRKWENTSHERKSAGAKKRSFEPDFHPPRKPRAPLLERYSLVLCQIEIFG